MLLTVNTSNGEGFSNRLPVLKYDARAGRLHLMDRVEANGQWSTTTTDITMRQPQFAVDFGSVEIGWLLFPKGGAPAMVTVPFGQALPPEPPPIGTFRGDDGKERPNRFKQGFRLKVAGKALATPDGTFVRELAANAGVTIEGVNELHTAYLAAPEAVAGKIPVVRIAETQPMKSGQSTNYKPCFEILEWVDRHEGMLGARTVPPPKAPAKPASPQASTPTAKALEDAVPF